MKKLKDISKKQWGLISTSIGSLLIFIGLLAMVGIGSQDTYAAMTCTCPSGQGYTLSGTTCTRTVATTTTCCAGGNCSNYSTCSSSYTNCVSQGTSSSGAILKKCTVSSTTTTIDATCTPITTTTTVAANFNGNYQSCTIPSGSTSCRVTAPSLPSGSTGWGSSGCTSGYAAGASISISNNVTYYPCYEKKTVAANFNGNHQSCTIANGATSCTVTTPSLPSGATGWGTSSGCIGGAPAGASISISSNVTYYPCYAKKTVAANFNGNYQSCTIANGATSCTVTTPSLPSGATGWGTSSGCIGGAPAGISVSISSNVTYYPCKASSSSSSCYTATFEVDGSVVNTITGKLDADGDGCEVTAPSYTCSSGSFKGWFTTPTVCKQDVSGTGAGNILTLASNKTYYGCCYKSSGNPSSSSPSSSSPKPSSSSPSSSSPKPSSSSPTGSASPSSNNPNNGLGSVGDNSNVNNNPSTATKAPLVIALMGVISLAFGVFTYWKNRKVTDM